MKKLNYPLILGTTIILFLILVSIFGQEIARFDPYATDLGGVKYIDGKFSSVKPPLPPSEVNIFGTDVLGRDIFSQLVIGTNITLKIALLITILKFIIALPIAFLAGFGGKFASATIKFFSTIFTTIPALIISILILNLAMFKTMELPQSILAFGIVLAIVGWGRLATTLRDRIKEILSEDFIQGEIAIGKSRTSIAIQNVMPHLTASIIVYIFLEIGTSLLMLAGLGVFEVYVGVNKLDMETIKFMRLSSLPSYNPEWGSLLASARYSINAMKPWVALFPASAFFISITGFNLLGEGLKHEINKRDSMVITWIKRLAFHLSPKTYIHELRNFKTHRKLAISKTLIIASIIIIPLIPPPISPYELNAEEVFSYLEELSQDKYEGRLVGTKGRDEAAEYIKGQLEEFGIKPFFHGDYSEEFPIKRPVPIVRSSSMKIYSKSGEELESFDFRENFNSNKIFYSSNESSNEIGKYDFAPGMEGEILTLEEFQKGKINESKKYFVVVNDNDLGNYKGEVYTQTITTIERHPLVQGIIVPVSSESTREYKSIGGLADKFNTVKWGLYVGTPYTIIVDIETGNRIRELEGERIVIENEGEVVSTAKGINIAGIIEGKSEDKPIVLVTNYDYLGYESDRKYKGLYDNGSSIAATLSIAERLATATEQPERSIIFLFLDGSKFNSDGATIFAMNEITDKDMFFIYMNYLGMSGEGSDIYIDTSLISTNNQEIGEYIKYLKNRAIGLEIGVKQDQLTRNNLDAVQLRKDGNSGIVINGKSLGESNPFVGMKQEDLSILDPNKLKDQSQLVIDVIAHIAYEGE